MANRLKFATFVTDYAYETFTQQLIKNACNLRSKSPKPAPVPCSSFSSLPFPSVHLQLWCRKIQMGQLNLQHFYECFVLGENFQGLSGDYGDVVCAPTPQHTLCLVSPLFTLLSSPPCSLSTHGVTHFRSWYKLLLLLLLTSILA